MCCLVSFHALDCRASPLYRYHFLTHPPSAPQHPALHYLVAQVSELLGLPQPPELLLRRDGPPHGAHAALLQVRRARHCTR